MKSTLSATPAYGRDYKSKAQLLADFEAGKDFLGFSMIERFEGYFSIRDKEELARKFDGIQFRYQKSTKTFIYKF